MRFRDKVEGFMGFKDGAEGFMGFRGRVGKFWSLGTWLGDFC